FSLVNPLSRASWFYFAASMLMLFSVAFRLRFLRWMSFASTLIGIGLHAYAFAERTMLGFKVSITNLYESMIAVAAVSALIGIVIAVVRKTPWVTIAGGLAAFFVLQVVDIFTVKFDAGIGGTIAVLANDTDADGDALTVLAINTQPTHGVAVVNPDSTITYTPAAGYAGSDSFAYVATDGTLASNVATVALTVSSDDLPPIPAGVAAQYSVNQYPRLQLGNAPLAGYAGSSLDRVSVLWQTKPAGAGTQDSFTVEYRRAGTNDAWQAAAPSTATATGVEGRVVRETAITGLQWNTDYQYRVRHLRGGGLVQEWSSQFHTRLAPNDVAAFSFVAYGDSAALASNTGFRDVQARINQIN
ncbi:MAG TPA: Ig-like domain-containing protein, partial [Pirellulaceae bacterium]|nr:Ig-like domain-containing protein [Pirellulaceae bacterium]